MNISGKHEIYKLNKPQLFLGLLLIVSPWIVLFITTKVLVHHSVFSSVPCWSDELAYWHEVLSFSQKGFNFGCYSMNEVLPKYLSFGAHGFGTVSVYALFGKIFGWKTYSIVIANAFFMSLAFLCLNSIVKLSSKNLFYILLFSLTYTPLILFTPTSMTELLNLSVLTIYFAILYAYFKHGGKKLLVFLFVFCTAISFIRIIYIVLFLPLLFSRRGKLQFNHKWLIYFMSWIVFSAFLFLLNNLFVSPYPDSFLNDLFSSNNINDFIFNFINHFFQNVGNLLNPFSDDKIQVLLRYFVIISCIYCLVKSKILQSRFKSFTFEYFIVFLILFSFILINIAAYDVFDWRDYRVLAPVLFGCVVFLILSGKRDMIYFSLAMNFLGVIFLIVSPEIVESFNKGRYTKPIENKVLNQIRYTENPTTRFQNTIVVQNFTKDIVMNVPAGIGITHAEELSDELQSNYIFSKNKLKLSTYKIINSNEMGYLYQKVGAN